ncbi:aldose epimerase family protein [Marinovum sp.]|uniref:aldose epimerase family protein n=1 Tax=Marinovum sp. TaxID=2024839 RepID=UPI002B27956A|nr:aldose epimerase family protein [Marinovum sp.]
MADDTQEVTIANGPARARVLSYGATLADFRLAGVDHALVLGSPDARAYRGPMRYFGAIVGPVANRVSHGRASLDGTTLQLDINENGNTLHGGPNGLSQQVWAVTASSAQSVTLGLTLADGEGGLPGPLEISVTYAIDGVGALGIEITAESERPTLCNPAFHGYWSLTGTGLAGHRLTVDADAYLPTDAALLPTGEVAPVAGTGYDLRRPVALPPAVDLDTNFCLNGNGMRAVARLETDRLAMTLETDAPGLQIYDAARLDTAPAGGHHGAPYGAHAGLALEPQSWPDAPNHPEFTQITLRPGAVFRQSTRFCFTDKDRP